MKKLILIFIASFSITYAIYAATTSVTFQIDNTIATRALNDFCLSTGYDFTSTSTTKLQWLKQQTINYWNIQIENAEQAIQISSDQVTVHNNIQNQIAPLIN